jgi:hypothetical protein
MMYTVAVAVVVVVVVVVTLRDERQVGWGGGRAGRPMVEGAWGSLDRTQSSICTWVSASSVDGERGKCWRP